MKLLVVVDMQNDFVSGVLGTPEAQGIVGAVREKILAEKAAGSEIIFTQDTHGDDYLATHEGKLLPVPHCIKGTPGWQIIDELADLAAGELTFEKKTFGSLDLAAYANSRGFDEVELIGLCTDICVISNAMLLRAALSEAEIAVDASCCAGVTLKSHDSALAAMGPCQIVVR